MQYTSAAQLVAVGDITMCHSMAKKLAQPLENSLTLKTPKVLNSMQSVASARTLSVHGQGGAKQKVKAVAAVMALNRLRTNHGSVNKIIEEDAVNPASCSGTSTDLSTDDSDGSSSGNWDEAVQEVFEEKGQDDEDWQQGGEGDFFMQVNFNGFRSVDDSTRVIRPLHVSSFSNVIVNHFARNVRLLAAGVVSSLQRSAFLGRLMSDVESTVRASKCKQQHSCSKCKIADSFEHIQSKRARP